MIERCRLYVLVLSFVVTAGCGGSGSGSSNDGGVSRTGGEANPTTTVGFAFDDFTGVSVEGPFSVTITPGPFSVEVTVDSGLHRLLDVREEGQILKIGFELGSDVNSQTLEVEIVMPTLGSISLAGATTGEISEFGGSFLDVQLAGVATLEGWNVGYDLLIAKVDGTSVLLLEDVSPLPAADINASAVSSATVNLMDGAVLTGTATSASTISYYGNDISIAVATDSTSSVTRLGDSRQ